MEHKNKYQFYIVESGEATEVSVEKALEAHNHPNYGADIIVISAKNTKEALFAAKQWDACKMPIKAAQHPFVKNKAMRLARTSGYSRTLNYIDIK